MAFSKVCRGGYGNLSIVILDCFAPFVTRATASQRGESFAIAAFLQSNIKVQI
jgi:hypothetical protein